MSTYCIGDIQGCYDELKQLLRIIDYDYKRDHLWFVGDLVNRGPKSLETLRFIKNLPNTKIVLGNHDLHLLNFRHKIVDFETNHLEPILKAPDSNELVEWLRMQPLIYHNSEHNCVLVHAGIYPGWDLKETLIYAKEAEKVLHSRDYVKFLNKMYGNKPSKWDNHLQGFERLRFIVNAFTRMRFCDLAGDLEFEHTGTIDNAPKKYLPWFQIPWRKTKDIKIIFGHWAALEGKTHEKNVIALDTGCIWGNKLTALRLEDNKTFSCKCVKNG